MLPPDVRAQLDLATLVECSGTFIDPALQHSQADLLFSLRTSIGGEALVYVLFEHQSSFDPTMPFRLLRYMVRIWEDWQKRHPAAATLPVILPLVMHHGDTAWSAAPELASMLDASPAMLDATAPFVPHFRFILDDLAALSVEPSHPERSARCRGWCSSHSGPHAPFHACSARLRSCARSCACSSVTSACRSCSCSSTATC